MIYELFVKNSDELLSDGRSLYKVFFFFFACFSHIEMIFRQKTMTSSPLDGRSLYKVSPPPLFSSCFSNMDTSIILQTQSRVFTPMAARSTGDFFFLFFSVLFFLFPRIDLVFFFSFCFSHMNT